MITSFKINQQYGDNNRKSNTSSIFDNKTNGSRQHSDNGKFLPKHLLANKILTALNDEDYARLVCNLQTAALKSGDVVYQPEDESQYVYFPETAVFSQINTLESGKTIEVALVGWEGIIGLSSVLGSKPNNSCTQTLISGSAFRLSTKVFNGLFAQSSAFQSTFFEYLGSYIRQISQRAVCNNHHRIEHRFATWVLMLADRCQNDRLFLTQEQIAAVLGVQRPSVTCIAQNLRSTGTIDYLRGQIILNRSKLEATACECYSVVR